MTTQPAGKMIQFGGQSGAQFIELEEDGKQLGAFQPDAPAPVPSKPASKIVGRIGPETEPAVEPATKPHTFRAQLTERRKVVAAQVRLLRQYERELGELDRMLAATKTTARKKSG